MKFVKVPHQSSHFLYNESDEIVIALTKVKYMAYIMFCLLLFIEMKKSQLQALPLNDDND